MKTRRTPAEMMRDSHSFFLTDGEWKFTNLSVSEYLEGPNDEKFCMVTYVVRQYFRITLLRFATKKKKSMKQDNFLH